jgi:hypothetical protein
MHVITTNYILYHHIRIKMVDFHGVALYGDIVVYYLTWTCFN